jgi:serine/threonine-protein kinase
MKLKFLFAIVLAAFMADMPISFGAEEKTKGLYGAFAYSPTLQHGSFSSAEVSRAAAEAAALRDCKATAKSNPDSCSIQLWFKSACGAIANGDGDAYGTGWGKTSELACNWAVKTCQKYHGVNCKGGFYSCSPSNEQGFCGSGLKIYQ